MNQSSQYLIKFLEAHGFVFKLSKGSHHIFFNSFNNVTVIVSAHGTKILRNVLCLPFLNRQVLIKMNFKAHAS
jgi:predicted RNA binding protein YcfA (HicA-like mRNA interferase family)